MTYQFCNQSEQKKEEQLPSKRHCSSFFLCYFLQDKSYRFNNLNDHDSLYNSINASKKVYYVGLLVTFPLQDNNVPTSLF